MTGFLVFLTASLAFSGMPQDASQDPPTQLEDVVVTAEERADMARTFVGRIAAPPRGRGLGRWRKICPGVVNLDRAVAQPIADQIAFRADQIGIEVDGPGCEANIVVVFTTEPAAVTGAMIDANPRVFRTGAGGTDRGGAALDDFLASEHPVRWWSLSVPVDSETGQRAVRVPGDQTGMVVDAALAAVLGCMPDDCAIGAAPRIRMTSSSRINGQIVDHLYKSIVIVDIAAVDGLNAAQMGDYLAMVTLSQVDPEARTDAFDTVLNLFVNPAEVAGLTAWDMSYLQALYSSPSRWRSVTAQASAVASIMNRDPALNAE